jgi:hypothetical protein
MDCGANLCETCHILFLSVTTFEVVRTSKLFLFTSPSVFLSSYFPSIHDTNTFQSLLSTRSLQGSQGLSSVPQNKHLTAPRRALEPRRLPSHEGCGLVKGWRVQKILRHALLYI